MTRKTELSRVSIETLLSLAYGEFAKVPMSGVPCQLASAAYDELERRQADQLAPA